MKPRVTLYTRVGCHLCDDAKRVIDEARAEFDFDYEEFDIDRDLELRHRYNEEAPVIAIDGVPAFRYRLSTGELLKKVADRA